METTSVTSKGQVTIPINIRRQLGIRKGSRVSFVLSGDHVELRIIETPKTVPDSGFGMLKRKRKVVPADCEAMASFDDRRFARRVKRLGLAPRIIILK